MEQNNQNTSDLTLLNKDENYKIYTDIELQKCYQQLINNKDNYTGDKLFFYHQNLHKLTTELFSRGININDIQKEVPQYKPMKYIENKHIVLSLKAFKKLSLENFEKGGFEKLGHARESFAKELGFDCYRAYLKSFENYWNVLSENISNIIKYHKKAYKPLPIILAIDTNWDYVDMLKDLFKSDFEYFKTFNIEALYTQGRKISEVNVYDLCTKQEYEYKYNDIIKNNSSLLLLNECGEDTRLNEIRENIKDLIPEKIYECIKTLERNIIDTKLEDNTNYLKMVIQILLTICSESLNSLSENEILEILNDKENGLPSKQDLETININQLYERLSTLGSTILKKSKYSQLITIDEAHNIMNSRMSNKPMYRELENKGKRKIFKSH